MAKHCDVCNNSYPDTEAHCPHCAAAAEMLGHDEAVVAEEADEPQLADVAHPTTPSDSAIDLGEPVVADLAGSSGSIHIDSPSDMDLHAHAPVTPGDSAVGGEPFVAEIASGVDLPGATVTETPPPTHGHGAGSDSAVGGEPYVAEVASGVDLGGGAYVAEVAEEESSAINLAELAGQPAGDSVGPDLGAEAAATQRAAPGENDAHFLDEVAEVEAGSAVNLGEAVLPTERPSSRDLIAEAVESGVDVAGEHRADEDVTEPDAVMAEAADSAVDLGASAAEQAPSSAPEAVPERRLPPGSHHDLDLDDEEATERVDLTGPTEEEDAVAADAEGVGPGSSGVDLGGVAGRPPKRPLGASSSAVEMENVAAGAAEVAEEEDEEAAAAAMLGENEEKPASAKARRKKAAEDEEEEGEAVEAEKDEEEEAVPMKAGKKAAADEDEDEPAPKKPAKARSGCGCLVAGGVLGLLIGAATPIGLAMFNVVDPAKEVGSLVGISPPAKTEPAKSGTNPGAQKPPEGGGAPTVADAGQHLKNGEFAKAVEGFNGAGDSDEVKAQRGTARWMYYLQDKMSKGEKPDAADDRVQKARADLQAAAEKDNPEAILALGNLQEYTATPADALKTYQDGLKKFAAKPNWARVFQAQIDRLDSTTARPADVSKPQTAAPRLGNDGDVSARALVMLLIAFQGEPAPGDDNAPKEAGFDFWAAVKLAQTGKYADAVKQLEAARASHEKLRFSRLRKAQNPLSDPTEDIFLRSAEEIEAYWTLQSYLAQQGIAGRSPAEVQKAVEALTKDAAQLKDVAVKLKTTPDKAVAGIDALVKERDDASKKAMLLETDLTTAKKDADAAKKEAKDAGDKLALTETQLKGVEGKLKASTDQLKEAGVKLAAADAAMDSVVAKIALAHAKVDRKDVLKGVDRVVEMALVNDPKGELMASRDEMRRLGAALAQRRSPQQMLDVWLPILVDRNRKGEAAKATVDAERVRGDDRVTAVEKKKASAVLGLAKRDLGDFDSARTLLAEALAGPGPKAEWQTPVAEAQEELTKPTAYYLPRARELYEDGKYQEAIVAIIEARKLFPKDAGNLQALNSLVQLEMARAKGKLDPASPAVIEAKKDAEAAAAAGSAEGNFALGRINEELGNLAEAKAAYAKALAAHGDADEAGTRYRLALARVLRLQGDKAGGRAAVPVGSIDMKRQPLLTLVLLVELGMQPGAGPNQDEANKLLEEVLNAKDGPDTFALKAQALALRGLWTPALKTYVSGLRTYGLLRRDYADGLADLIERHPALRRPASMDPPNPLLAEASYASGLRHYFARRYGDAETAFAKAIEYDNQDARYFYFLGLSRLALDKTTDADADFRDGAQLELLNRPGREAVSTALERVQGTARQAVNRVRP